MSNLNVLNAIPYVAEHGCKWRGLPKRFGNWHTTYTREPLVQAVRALSGVRAVAAVAGRAHPHRGCLAGFHRHQGSSRRHRGTKKAARRPLASPEAAGPPRFIWLPRMLERP
jgi:transposase